MDAPALRAEMPVLDRLAYFNAGTCGPLPRAAVEALTAEAQRAASEGRTIDYLHRGFELKDRLRAAYAALLGASPEEVGITSSTSEGIVRVLAGLDLGPDDEVLIAEHEHPGLLGPLGAARTVRGFAVRAAPLARLADEAGPATKLIACSHVAWTTGELAPDFTALPRGVPVLLDGAQGVGAVPVDVHALGCAFYAGSGQKWLCGPVGTGMLWVAPPWRDRLAPSGPTYVNLADPAHALDSPPWPDGRRFDSPTLAVEVAAAALAAHDTLAAHGWPEVHERARDLAAQLAAALAERGRDVASRGATTLVSWTSEDPAAEVGRLADAGVVVRGFADLPWVRASVGAWNDQADVERLVSATG